MCIKITANLAAADVPDLTIKGDKGYFVSLHGTPQNEVKSMSERQFTGDKKLPLKSPLAIIFLMTFNPVNASLMMFPDSSGKIVAQTSAYAIRLIETPNSTVKTAEAIFTIQGTPTACNEVILDFGRYPEFMPNIRWAQFVSSRDGAPIYRFGFKVAFWTISYTNIFFCSKPCDSCYAVTWDFIEGDIKKTTGSWDIRPDPVNPGRTLIRYKVYIETGKLVPGWVRNILTTKSIPKMIEAIGRRVGTD